MKKMMGLNIMMIGFSHRIIIQLFVCVVVVILFVETPTRLKAIE